VGKNTLVAGSGDALLAALAAAASARSRSVVLARPPAAGDGALPLPEGIAIAEYRPGSALSARGLVLEAQSGRGPLSEILIAAEPRLEFEPILDGDPRSAQASLDEGPVAWLQLIREAVRHFRKTGAGALALCVPGSGRRKRGDDAPPGLRGAEDAMLEAIADACLAESTPALPVYAFSGPAADWGPYAEAVFDVLDGRGARAEGRWTKAGKPGLFGLGR